MQGVKIGTHQLITRRTFTTTSLPEGSWHCGDDNPRSLGLHDLINPLPIACTRGSVPTTRSNLDPPDEREEQSGMQQAGWCREDSCKPNIWDGVGGTTGMRGGRSRANWLAGCPGWLAHLLAYWLAGWIGGLGLAGLAGLLLLAC